MVEFNELGIQHCLCAKHRTRDQEEIPREQDMSVLKEARAMGEADAGAEALVGTLKEQGARRLQDHGQGAPGPKKFPEIFLEEVTLEFSLKGGEEKQKEIPGRGGTCSLGETRVDGSAGPCKPPQGAMGGFRAESDLLVLDPYTWARHVRG